MNKKEILKQLSKNRTKNISTIGIINNYGLEESIQAGNSILFTVQTDHLWSYQAAETEEELKELLKQFHFQTLYFASLEDWMLTVISKQREIEWGLKTERLIFPKTV